MAPDSDLPPSTWSQNSRATFPFGWFFLCPMLSLSTLLSPRSQSHRIFPFGRRHHSLTHSLTSPPLHCSIGGGPKSGWPAALDSRRLPRSQREGEGGRRRGNRGRGRGKMSAGWYCEHKGRRDSRSCRDLIQQETNPHKKYLMKILYIDDIIIIIIKF